MSRPAPHRGRIAISLLIAGAAAGVWAPPSEAQHKVAFVTSVQGNGDLGSWPDSGGLTGLSGGDAICRARAAVAGLPNSQDFIAWLSNEETDAYCHLHGLTGTREENCDQEELPATAGPWVRTDGFPFMDRIDLALAPDHRVFAPITVDEFGAEFTKSAYFWTATGTSGQALLPVGLYQSHACGNWSSAVETDVANGGSNWGSSGFWTLTVTAGCDDDEMRLLCLEGGLGPALPEVDSLGARAFLTSVSGTGDLSSWPDSGGETGVAAGDAICRTRAAAAGLWMPQSFKAWLSAAGVDAVNRFSYNGPWVRLDGVRIIEGKADLVDGSIFSGLNVTEQGAYLGRQIPVWTGTYDEGTAVRGRTCEGWTSASDALEAQAGEAPKSRWAWSQNRHWTCDTVAHLYCLSEVSDGIFGDDFEESDLWAWTVSQPGGVHPSSVAPDNGIDVGGDVITITGSGFSSATGAMLGGSSCDSFEIVDDEHVRCTTPPHAVDDVDVTVMTATGHGTLRRAYRYTGEEDDWVEWAEIEWPSAISTSVGVATETILGQVRRQFDTPLEGESPSMIAQLGYGPAGSWPGRDPGWVWFDAEWDSQYYGNDRYRGALVIPEIGVYSYTFRFSVNGGYSFFYADFDPGTADGFNPDELGTVVVE